MFPTRLVYPVGARESAGVADPKLVASERKPSDLSQRRADAGDPYLNDEMFDKLEGLFDDHYEREILKTPRPRASQVYTGDEMGLNPKGKWYRVYCGPFQTRAEASAVKKNLDDLSRVRFTRISKVAR